MLDNASTDGSVGVARNHPTVDLLITRDQRRGKAQNDTTLLRRARGRYVLLLNEDSELLPGATLALHDAMERQPARGRRRCEAAAPQRTSPAECVALPVAVDGAGGRAGRPPLDDGAESRRRPAARRLGAERGAARAPAGGARDRLVRPAVLRLLRRGRLLQAPRRCRLAHRLRPVGRRDPRRAAVDRRGPRAADRRALAQPRPLHAQAPQLAVGRARPLADRVDLRRTCARGDRPSRATTPSATGSTCRRRCTRSAARACARRRWTTTAAARGCSGAQ